VQERGNDRGSVLDKVKSEMLEENDLLDASFNKEISNEMCYKHKRSSTSLKECFRQNKWRTFS
jgi:hypothetical protein